MCFNVSTVSFQMDYFIRAKRLEEIPLLEQHAEEQSVKNKDQWDKMELQRVCCCNHVLSADYIIVV